MKDYRAGDVVAHDGGSSVALLDDPGPLPGDGWAQLTQRGKNGKPGERGERGEKGLPGKDGTGIDDLFIERGMLVVLLTDGRHKELPLAGAIRWRREHNRGYTDCRDTLPAELLPLAKSNTAHRPRREMTRCDQSDDRPGHRAIRANQRSDGEPTA